MVLLITTKKYNLASYFCIMSPGLLLYLPPQLDKTYILSQTPYALLLYTKPLCSSIKMTGFDCFIR